MTSQSPDVMDCSVSALALAFGHRTQTFTHRRSVGRSVGPRVKIPPACDRTWETDMEMWKNLPLPPCGMARVKKSFRPSLENRGSSF